MIPRIIISAILAIGFIISPGYAQLQAEPNDPQSSPTSAPAWLGIWVQTLSSPLRAQLSSLITSDEGLMITRVEPNSPAERAGLRQFDVLLSFNGQKLYSPEQLFSLVYHTPADESVNLQVIQQGQLQSLSTSLSPRKTRTLAQTRRQPPPYSWRPYYQPPPPPVPKTVPPVQDMTAWDLFESIEVKTLPDGRYQATVSFKDASEEVKTFTFEGKKSEIVAQIETLPELPAAKKQALLKALNMRPDMAFDLDRFGWDSDLFDSPLFGSNPFDHPFFNHPIFKDPSYLNRPFAPPGYVPAPYPPPWQFHIYPKTPYGQYSK